MHERYLRTRESHLAYCKKYYQKEKGHIRNTAKTITSKKKKTLSLINKKITTNKIEIAFQKKKTREYPEQNHRERMKAYCQKNRDHICEWMKDYRQRNQDRLCLWMRDQSRRKREKTLLQLKVNERKRHSHFHYFLHVTR